MDCNHVDTEQKSNQEENHCEWDKFWNTAVAEVQQASESGEERTTDEDADYVGGKSKGGSKGGKKGASQNYYGNQGKGAMPAVVQTAIKALIGAVKGGGSGQTGNQGGSKGGGKGGKGCYNCGKSGHLARDCQHGRMCHRCGKTGHLIKDCRMPVREVEEEENDEAAIVWGAAAIDQDVDEIESHPETSGEGNICDT